MSHEDRPSAGLWQRLDRAGAAFVALWLLAGGWLGWELDSAARQLEARQLRELEATLKAAGDAIQGQLQSVGSALAWLRDEMDDVRQAIRPAPALNRRLKVLAGSVPAVQGALVLDGRGIVVAASEPARVGTDQSGRAYFRRLREVARGDVLDLDESQPGLREIVLAQMLQDEDGGFAGVLLAVLDPAVFDQILALARQRPDDWIRLSDADGVLFFARPGGEVLAAPQLSERLQIAPHLHALARPLVLEIGRDRKAALAPQRREAWLWGGLWLCIGGIGALQLALRQVLRRQQDMHGQLRDFQCAHVIERLRLATEAAGIGMWQYDLRLRRVEWDATLLKLCGLEPGQVDHDPRTWRRRIRRRDLRTFERALGDAMYGGQPVHAVLGVRRGDGVWRALSCIAQVLPDEDGQARWVIGSCEDISERLDNEAALRAAKTEAEAASLAKSRFLANMSHEIRTPMNAVLGLLHLLLHSGLNPRQQGYASKAYEAGKSLLGILNDILDFSKVEAGKVELEHSPFHLDSVLKALDAIIHSAPGGKALRFTVSVDPRIPRTLTGDALRLKQVLLNLVGNAIKFTPAGEVRVELLARQLEPERVLIEFAVSDTGIGIPPALQRHIFEGFVQAEASTTRRFGGTGLGLAISQHLVQLMGGSLQLQSQPGLGSRFHFTIWIERDLLGRSAPPADEPAGEARGGLEGFRLLLVEDNPISREVAHELLSFEGAEVDVAASGAQALIRLRSADRPYDAVLLDIQMPDMDGHEVTRIIRGELGLRDLPVIAMTANVTDADREACLAAGMNDHVGKPIEVAVLVATILRHCPPANRRPFQSAPPPVPEAPPHLPPPPAGSGLPPAPPGIELDAALARIGGQVRPLLRALRRFADERSDSVERARELWLGGDRVAASRIMHALKGVAATVGATQISELASQAQHILQQPEPHPDEAALLEQLDTQHKALIGQLEAWLRQVGEDGG